MATLHVSTLLASLLLCLALGWAAGNTQEIREPPNIIKPAGPNTTYVKDNSNVRAECQAEGKPAPRYKWQKDGNDLYPVSNKIIIDEMTGVLEIKSFTVDSLYDDNGEYRCLAETEYTNPGQRTNTVVALSPIITFTLIELETGNIIDEAHTKMAYEYFSMPCEPIKKAVAEHINLEWYTSGVSQKQINIETSNNRLFIDQKGTLHYMYLLESDTNQPPEVYRCSVNFKQGDQIKMLNRNKLTVTPTTNPVAYMPTLKYKTDSAVTKFQIHSNAQLECVFAGGYDSESSNKIPEISWFDKNGDKIFTNHKYTLESNNRRLLIDKINEDDEGDYFCQGKNSAGNTELIAVNLDIISAPIFVNRPSRQTEPEGENAKFNCEARSLRNETKPDPAKWFINGIATGLHTDPKKYVISGDSTSLTVTTVNKARDILCVQCSVKNPYGVTWGLGCLNVILSIEITNQPPVQQDIQRGELIELSVTATTDPSMTLSLEWTFNNNTYKYDELPHTIQQDQRLFINTSELTDEEYRSVQGVYHLKLTNVHQKKEVMTEVILVDPLPTEAPVVVKAASFPMWIIIVIVAIIVLIIIIAIIVCCVCKKQQEGDYNVDKKEVGAGLDPKKELMEKGFDDYSRPNLGDYEDVPRQPLPYDEDVPLTGDDQKSLGEYSEDDEARLGFNEDGSFIGQYYKKDVNHAPSSDYENQNSQSIV